MKRSVQVRARVEVDIHVGTWGEKAVMADLAEQARREASQSIQALLADKGVKIIGLPKIIFVQAMEEL